MRRDSALSISCCRKKFSAVRSTTMAPSCPISVQVGATAVRRMSAPSSSSSATANQRPSRSPHCFLGVRLPGDDPSGDEQQQRPQGCLDRGQADQQRGGGFDTARQQ